MSLREAIEEVIQDMELDLSRRNDDFSVLQDITNNLKGYIRQLKTIAKLVDNNAQPKAPTTSHREMIERARAEMRKDKELETQTIECLGGPADKDFLTVSSRGKVGDRLMILGSEYQLKEDGKLHYIPKK